MSDNTVRDDQHKLLFEQRWFTPLVKACKQEGLDWIRMSAIVYQLSGGDPQMRTLDWDYIESNLGADNPLYSEHYDELNRPSEAIIDRGTRWGLFQVHGDIAQRNGYKGQFAGLTSIDASIKAGVCLMKFALEEIEVYAEQCDVKAIEFAEQKDNNSAADKMKQADEAREGLPANAETDRDWETL